MLRTINFMGVRNVAFGVTLFLTVLALFSVFTKGMNWGLDFTGGTLIELTYERPADVTKVMRQELPEWIKSPRHAIVAPVNKALFGGWEGNWMAWNMAHDLRLPGSEGPELGFFMYPTAETGGERLDSYAPDSFRYQITATEIKA